MTQETAAEMTRTVVCDIPSASSGLVLLTALLVALLLWPDASEIAVLGVALKRRVDRAQDQAERATEEVRALSVQLALATANASAAASSNLHFTFNGDRVTWGPRDGDRLREEYEDVRKKGPDLRNFSSSREGAGRGVSTDALKYQLLHSYEEFAQLLALNDRRPKDAEFGRLRQAFLADYEPTLVALRRVRNAVAHASEVSREDVLNALDLARAMVPLAKNWFGARGVELDGHVE
ncbi:hypothetical protein [Demequina lignilytica]|uniref:Swt1-like HEPN domain-containing protein n=1 Tax=Demequina lignilytica TaxID=3051663 RepID=A0AB35MHM3_9MICO|nr:hypothetical protein [Demequina sp. SYSU T0a273]MDN4483210.1 hypothetical protein [Demequina sp. SYSU T0a273]